MTACNTKSGMPTRLEVRLPPLEREELDHYSWLIGGLLDGVYRLAASECPETSIVPAVIDESRSLLDELFARIVPADEVVSA